MSKPIVREKGMKLHWFLTHVTPILGIISTLYNGSELLDTYSNYTFNIWMLFDFIVLIAHAVIFINMFKYRKEYSMTAYKWMMYFIFFPLFVYGVTLYQV